MTVRRTMLCQCGAELEPGRSHATVVGGVVVLRCDRCAGLGRRLNAAPVRLVAPERDSVRPVHRAADVARDLSPAPARKPTPTTLAPPGRRIRGLLWVSLAFALLASGSVAFTIFRRPLPGDAPLAVLTEARSRMARPETRIISIYSEELPFPDELAPVISSDRWVHPVAGSEEKVPDRASRKFKAWRPGKTRPRECGRGHCGVDLDAPRGSPVIAVFDGVVKHIERGRNRRGGMYVQVVHDDGMITWYMHLDDILDGLSTGDHVETGEMIGSLGKTGIQSSEPHLHFAVSAPTGNGSKFVDPAPHLAKAHVLGVLDIVVKASDSNE